MSISLSSREMLMFDVRPGDDVIVPPTVSTPDAKEKFGSVREVKS